MKKDKQESLDDFLFKSKYYFYRIYTILIMERAMQHLFFSIKIVPLLSKPLTTSSKNVALILGKGAFCYQEVFQIIRPLWYGPCL